MLTSFLYHFLTAQVAIVKDDVANIFKRSPRAKKLFPELQPGTCAAISLARFAQEPLMEYCSLWCSADAVETFGYELLYLDLHPLKVAQFFYYKYYYFHCSINHVISKSTMLCINRHCYVE